MAIYYVKHPTLDLSATIDAPSTEKARTTYLDYLERGGNISRGSRQYYRRNLIADRVMDPSEVPADIHLSYGYQEDHVSPQSYSREELEPVYRESEVEEIDLGREEMVEAPIETGQEQRVPAGLSPIQQISLGRYR